MKEGPFPNIKGLELVVFMRSTDVFILLWPFFWIDGKKIDFLIVTFWDFGSYSC